MVEATTSVIPMMLPVVGMRCSMNHFANAATTTCDNPTTLTRAGEPVENAFVKQSWPTVAASPIPINRITLTKSMGRVGGDTGTSNHTTRLHAVATPEKWATIARVSMCLTRCKFINATPLNMPARMAIGIAVLGVEKLLGEVDATILLAYTIHIPRQLIINAIQVFFDGRIPNKGQDKIATQSGYMLVKAKTISTS